MEGREEWKDGDCLNGISIAFANHPLDRIKGSVSHRFGHSRGKKDCYRDLLSHSLSIRLIPSYELVEGVCYRAGRVGLRVELNGSRISFVVP